MSSVLRPETADQILEAVAWAAAAETPLEIVAGGTKRGIGRPLQVEHTLDVSGLVGITLYEPDELVLSARAGTPMTMIDAALAAEGQALAFEPPDLGPVLGGTAGGATIGGVLAANLGGPRRIKMGAARDHFLGLSAVSGRGEAFKSGGRVVKNVTGYDLCKVLAGSWGTLAVMTDVTIKVLPAPETEVTLVLDGLDARRGVAALCAAMGSDCEVSAAAFLPPETAAAIAAGAAFDGTGSAALLRLDGFAPSVAYRSGRLAAALGDYGAARQLEADRSRAVWRAVRDLEPFVGSMRPLWKVSVAPTRGPDVLEAVAAAHPVRALLDWSGGLVWIEVDGGETAEAAIRGAVARAGGGHATLVRAEMPVRAATAVFQPQEPALAGLSARLKEAFDPRGILNPGRMYPGAAA